MKRLALLATTVLFAAGATHAREVTSIITDSVQMSVTPYIAVVEPLSESYAVSGTNINAATLGSITNDGVGSYSIDTAGQPFQFSESYMEEARYNTQVSSPTPPTLPAQPTPVIGGSGGSSTTPTFPTMTGYLDPKTGLATGTPGGPGSSIILQRSLELTVIQ